MLRFSARIQLTVFFIAKFALLANFAGNAIAQEPKIEVQAVAGTPLGVGKLTIRFPPGTEPRLVQGQDVWLDDKEGRILYPSFDRVTLRRQLGLDTTTPLETITAGFLFRGDQPFDLTFDMAGSHAVHAVPIQDEPAHKALLNAWWDKHSFMVESLAASDLYPLHVENYVSAMLARRLKLRPADAPKRWSGHSDIEMIFGTLSGTESIRLAMQRETLLKSSDTIEKADLPLPRPAAPPAVAIPDVPGDVAIEPIATHVPAECFYLRCKTISNLQWLRAMGEQRGGSLRDLAAIRGLDYDIREHVEHQLALHETVSARLFGDVVIDDMAVIGSDMFIREGPAIGVLFHAANSRALSTGIALQRQDAIRAARATPELMVQERILEIAGHKVSFLESADNSVRSFYAVDGDFHLVTTSETIARRFFEAGAGKDSLADLKEFRYARSLMPLSRDDALFVYLSDPWFRQLVSPRYRVEMTRRMTSEAEIEIVHLAQLAAQSEKQPSETIEQLITGGFLPAGFGRHSDGSRVILGRTGVVDSLRGARRSLLPIPDVEISGITATEFKAYEEFSQMYRRLWERVDPVIIGVKRELQQAPDGRREKVVLDLHITPYARTTYQLFAMIFAPPDKKRIALIPGNVFELEAGIAQHVLPVAQGAHEIVRLFAGLRDFKSPFTFSHGKVIHDPAILDFNGPFYLGNTGGFSINRFGSNEPVPEGYSELEGSGRASLFDQRWTRKFDGFVVEAAEKALLETVTPQLKLEEARRPAQLRLHVADLAALQVAEILHASGYERSRAASAANVHILHALMQQLRVAPEKSMETMHSVFAARPACPLEGDYELDKNGPGHVRWKSTGWAKEHLGDENSVPPDYKFPLLEWFRGLDLEFSIDATTLTTHVELLLAQ